MRHATGLELAEVTQQSTSCTHRANGSIADPKAGDMMAGTGGVRKARLAGRGKGKSGGYRIVWYFGGEDLPVFLLTVFGQGEKATLTQGERNALRSLTATLRESLK